MSPLSLLAVVAIVVVLAVVAFALGHKLGQSAEQAVLTAETSRIANERARF